MGTEPAARQNIDGWILDSNERGASGRGPDG
jgi:hypothetical protein